MRRQSGVSLVEIAMMFVVISIVAVVALPSIGKGDKPIHASAMDNVESIQKVKTAYAMAMAEQGDYPQLTDVVDNIDADFASQTNDHSGIIFREGKLRLTVSTFRDMNCKQKTSNEEPGVSDIVRCI